MSAPCFSAEIVEVKLLYNILKAICFQEFAVVRPMEEGLKITVEDTKCSEASVYIPESTFVAYHVANDEEIHFKLNLKVLTECLHIYGEDGTPSLKMSYKAHGSPLCLILKHSEENITVDCQLTCMDVDNFKEIALAEECNVNNIVFNGDQFVEVLSDLDMLADEFELQIDTKLPYFRIQTSSVLGESVVNISKLSEMVAIFQCKQEFIAKYPFSNLRQILKVMGYASKVSMSTGESGLLGIQLIINSERNCRSISISDSKDLRNKVRYLMEKLTPTIAALVAQFQDSVRKQLPVNGRNLQGQVHDKSHCICSNKIHLVRLDWRLRDDQSYVCVELSTSGSPK